MTAWPLCMYILWLQVPIRAEFRLSVLLEAYRNQQHRASGLNGGCCESNCGDCQNKLKFCLRDRSGIGDIQSSTCSLGYKETRVVEMDDNSYFSSGHTFIGVNEDFQNPVTFTGDIWTVRYMYVMYLPT